MIENCTKQEKLSVLEYLGERFGITADLFDGFDFYSGGQGRVYLAPKGISQVQKIVTAGLSIARASSSIKPSTNFFQSFGHQVKRNIILPNKEKVLKYLRGEDFQIDGSEQNGSSKGYVMVQYKDYFLGCGLFQNNWIKNVLPKEKRLDIKFI